MADALVTWPFKLLQSQIGCTIGFIQLFGTRTRIPLRHKSRQVAPNLFETDTVRPLVGPSIIGKLDLASWDNTRDDFCQIANTIVMRGVAYIECFIEHLICGRFESGNEGAGDIFNMNDRPPR